MWKTILNVVKLNLFNVNGVAARTVLCKKYYHQRSPQETLERKYSTNKELDNLHAFGTLIAYEVEVLDSCRKQPSLKAVIRRFPSGLNTGVSHNSVVWTCHTCLSFPML